MSTRELNKGKPILRFFAPTRTDTAPFCQPAERALHDPTAGWMFLLIRDRLRQRFASAPTVTDVALVVGLRNHLVDISRIIRFVQAQVLFACRSVNDNREDKIVHRPFIVLIGAGDVNRQGCPSFIDQDVHLRPTLASVCWIAACRLATQGRGNRLAVDSLPLPANSFLSGIETDQTSHDLPPNALLLPCLESLVQDTAGDTEPLSMNSFPLTTSPQHVPDAIDNSPVVGPRPARSRLLWRFGQIHFDAAPQWARDAEIVDIFGLLFILAVQDAPRWTFVFGQTDCPQGASFV